MKTLTNFRLKMLVRGRPTYGKVDDIFIEIVKNKFVQTILIPVVNRISYLSIFDSSIHSLPAILFLNAFNVSNETSFERQQH